MESGIEQSKEKDPSPQQQEESANIGLVNPRIKTINPGEFAKIHPSIRQDFQEWCDDPGIDIDPKRRALAFFKSAHIMDPAKSPYDYEERDFKNVPIQAPKSPHKKQFSRRTAGVAFFKYDINKLRNVGFREYITNHSSKAKTRSDDVGEQQEESANIGEQQEESANIELVNPWIKKISEKELSQIHPSIREDFKEWYNNPPTVSSNKSRALEFFKSAQEINPDKSPYAYAVEDLLNVPVTQTQIQTSGVAFLKYDLSKLRNDELKDYVKNHDVKAKTRSDAGKQRMKEPAFLPSSSAIAQQPAEEASEATQIANDETYARQLQQEEDARKVLSSEEAPRGRGPQGEPLPKSPRSEAGSSGLHTGLSNTLLDKCMEGVEKPRETQRAEGEVSSVQPQGIPKPPIPTDDDLSNVLSAEEECLYIRQPSSREAVDETRSSSAERDNNGRNPYLGISEVLGDVLRGADTRTREGAPGTRGGRAA